LLGPLTGRHVVQDLGSTSPAAGLVPAEQCSALRAQCMTLTVLRVSPRRHGASRGDARSQHRYNNCQTPIQCPEVKQAAFLNAAVGLHSLHEPCVARVCCKSAVEASPRRHQLLTLLLGPTKFCIAPHNWQAPTFERCAASASQSPTTKNQTY
jgi:hypothetical protein